MNKVYTYNGCKFTDKKKRKELSGLTYSELQKMWRLSNREAKLLGYRMSFKEWRDNLFSIVRFL